MDGKRGKTTITYRFRETDKVSNVIFSSVQTLEAGQIFIAPEIGTELYVTFDTNGARGEVHSVSRQIFVDSNNNFSEAFSLDCIDSDLVSA